MFCKKCGVCQSFNQQNLNLTKFHIDGKIVKINCNICNYFLAIIYDDKIIDVNKIIDENIENGWRKVQLNRDKILYYILSQIIYPQIDTPKKDKYECYYDYCDKNDDVYLRWLDGKPVGFYTIKHKGTEIISCEKIYQMNTIDTAYIRSEYRNQGLGIEILHDVIKHYQDQDIGFSKPISDGMFQVLKKFLIKQKEYRLRFWEIEDGGTEGSAKLVWFILKKHFKN